MAHKFDAAQRQKLDNPWRRAMLPPEETLHKLGLQEDEIIADIGCGIGYFSFPAAKITGPAGKVYALDLSPEMLQEVETKQAAANIPNLEVVRVDEYDLKLAPESVTVGFLANVLHEIDNPAKFVAEIRRILNHHGKLMIVEWKKQESAYGPPLDHRIGKNDVVKILEMEGFRGIETIDLGTEFYGITAHKR
jgi:ubiquinone/menaquinone biosynthesis C-methylase UbiE